MGTHLQTVEIMKLAHFFVVGATAQWWNIGGNNDDNNVAKVDTTTQTLPTTTVFQPTMQATSKTAPVTGKLTTLETTSTSTTSTTTTSTTTTSTSTKIQSTKPTTSATATQKKTTTLTSTTTEVTGNTTPWTPTGTMTTTPVDTTSNVTVIYFTTPVHHHSQCLQMRDDVLNSGIVGAWVPSCDVNGSFAPKQCNGSARTCWCVEPISGEMIDETSVFNAELECDRQDHHEHNQDGLGLWDFNLHDMINQWIGKGGDDDATMDVMNKWLGSNAANVNFAPQNTNVQNFININTQMSADVNFNIAGQDLKLSSIFARLAQHGNNKAMMMKEFENCLKEFGIEQYIKQSWPMIKQFAHKYGIDEDCLREIEQKLMESFE